ncbi:MAG: hypothetical protein NTW16_02305 [Bacteroidetes bacterium]|nr:hypothetical protein [Bacteroidota bacterium]
MSEGVTTTRLSKAAREFNIGIKTVVDFLIKKGFQMDMDPNAKLSQEMYNLLMKEFASEKHVKEEAKKIGLQFAAHETITIEDKKTASKDREKELDDLFIKNVSMDFEKKQYEAAKKPREVAVKEVVKEVVKEEIVAGITLPAEPAPPVVIVAEEKPQVQVVIEEPQVIPAVEPILPEIVAETAHPEIPETPVASVPDDKITEEQAPLETAPPPIAVPEAKTDQKQLPDLKIVGMMDLGVFEKKLSKKTKVKPQPEPDTIIPAPLPEVVIEDKLPEAIETVLPASEPVPAELEIIKVVEPV